MTAKKTTGAKKPGAQRATGEHGHGEQPLVLIADDFGDAREMYREYLVFSGFRAAEARDGKEAIERAHELAPSVILMDLAIPSMDGWEATRRLKADARTKKIPVIAITGHALSGDAERARAAGCDGVLSKPCLPERVVEEVRRVLARRRA
ncbi:response regulator [Sandaracinus amylolyticus]|uniref:response regulator n=1 Tax=Sandaracinus amylolyticus TaxID=927083 RepID=UPI0022A6A378|nr:response regulator [Sandaracinus amylolyticus]UJR86380.1 Hypothetical protein I5071_84750 [Sandaracinus amylolyticus]